jgi:hypothetical protein
VNSHSIQGSLRKFGAVISASLVSKKSDDREKTNDTKVRLLDLTNHHVHYDSTTLAM